MIRSIRSSTPRGTFRHRRTQQKSLRAGSKFARSRCASNPPPAADQAMSLSALAVTVTCLAPCASRWSGIETCPAMATTGHIISGLINRCRRWVVSMPNLTPRPNETRDGLERSDDGEDLSKIPPPPVSDYARGFTLSTTTSNTICFPASG